MASSEETKEEYNINLTKWENLAIADVVIAAVSHDYYLKKSNNLFSIIKSEGIFVDVKSCHDKHELIKRGYKVWRL